MRWFSFLDGWLKGGAKPPEALDDAAFTEKCLEDPVAAKYRLKADQRALGEEIESLFRLFDERLASLAQRAHTMSDADVRHEASRLREAQDGLRKALRRLDVSMKETRALQRELAEWESRKDDGALHADHPTVRSEMIRSELAVRGITRELPAKLAEEGLRLKPAIVAEEPDDDEADEVEAPEVVDDTAEMYVFRAHEPAPSVDAQNLVRAIREATHEVDRWHAIPMQLHDRDALDQVRHIRELHAILKRLDRERGITRDRIEMAVSPRGLR